MRRTTAFHIRNVLAGGKKNKRGETHSVTNVKQFLKLSLLNLRCFCLLC